MNGQLPGQIHGMPIIGMLSSYRTDGQKTSTIILVDRGSQYEDRYVTGFYWTGDSEWSNGHYFRDIKYALPDFYERGHREIMASIPSKSDT